MALAAGSRLGSYEILSALGSGGMGEVYRARDRKLKRQVALKVLPAEFADQPERRARLQHEAELLAALNHPNIAIIYGVEDSAHTVALVMELVEGEPLNEKIRAKGMPLSDVLKLAIQIASGLEAAHRVGIVHRDLKPSNVMVTPTDVVKLVDFGLAKILKAPSAAPEESETTSAIPRTEEGQILGTVVYMSPEQAQGKPVDARSDVFSFGTLLYEMLTGTKPFQGENRVSTITAILQQDPKPLAEVTATLPREAERIVLRCLRKDPARRFQTASDLRLALEDLKEDSAMGRLGSIPAAALPATSRWPSAAAAAAIAAIVAGASYWFLRPRAPAPRALQQITFEAGIAKDPALSPDGKLLAYASDRGGDGQLDIWLNQLAGGEPVRLTSGPGSKSSPQFSADGTRIYYISGGEISEVPTLGGTSRRIFAGAGPFAVSSRGEIAFYQPRTGTAPGPITILPAGGGAPESWHPECRSSAPPVWSPDGDRIMFAGVCAPKVFDPPALYVSPRHNGSIQRIGEAGALGFMSRPAWFRLRNGREGVMLPVRSGDSVNLYRMSLDGREEPATQGTGSETWPVVSPSGELIFTRAEETPAVWSLPLDGRHGQPSREAAPARNFGTSRDGTKLVYGRMLGARRGQLVMRDRMTGAETVLATHDVFGEGAGSFWPQVSPDGTLIIYRALVPNRPSQYLVSAGGGEARAAVPASTFNLAGDWFPDGRRVIGECAPTELGLPGAMFGICDLDPATGMVRRLLKAARGDELLSPSLSWDGKWVSFMLRRSGRTVICATPVRPDGTVASEADWIQISPENADASRPRFSPDGTTIYYELKRKGTLILVKQKLDPTTKRTLEQPLQLAQVEISGNVQNIVTVTRDRVFFNTDEIRSNIWVTRLE
jgi:eukaryotic-like serine/threonine-protein kinase